jgi:hypothetical protein
MQKMLLKEGPSYMAAENALSYALILIMQTASGGSSGEKWNGPALVQIIFGRSHL